MQPGTRPGDATPKAGPSEPQSPSPPRTGPAAPSVPADAPEAQLPLDDAARDPADVWHDFFAKRKPAPRETADLLLRLHAARRHAHVEAAIEAALVHGQGQPWMYDSLAATKKILGRPARDVERVLLSRIDFTAVDVPNMLFSAAYLVRFGAPDAALRMYRQAARLDPVRSEPYVLGLRLAREHRDADAVEWAVVGILTSDWNEGHEAHHKQALDAAAETQAELRAAGREDEALRLARAVEEARERDLVLTLEWSGNADLDLVVDEPGGTRCAFDRRRTAGGGILTRDGLGPLPRNCREEYVCARGQAGTYVVRVRHVWGEVVGKRATLVVTRHAGSPRESVRTLVVPLEKDDALVRISLPSGRRTEAAAVPRDAQPLVSRTGRGSLRQMLGQGEPGTSRSAAAFGRSRAFGGAAPPVGFAPVVTVLSEGSTMSALAVVSGDRRYVRLTVAPAFTTITDVFTFSFQQ